MPQGMSQWACAIVVGRSQLVRRDMGLLASRVLVGGPGDLVAGVGTGGHGRSGKCRSVPGACQMPDPPRRRASAPAGWATPQPTEPDLRLVAECIPLDPPRFLSRS